MTGIVNYQMLIDGQQADASDGIAFSSINPANAQPWAQVPEATQDDVERAVAAAQRAFSEGPWPKLTATERGRCLRRLADLIAQHSERLGHVECVDTGKLFAETRWQAKYASEFIEFYAGCADKLEGKTLSIDKPDMFVFSKREPLGVVAAVVPWNSQLFLTSVKLGPALAAGNTMVIKPSELASAPLLEFGELIAEAGIPDGVINIITGHGAPCGKALTSHPDVARIAFTGGAPAARQVIANSASNFAEVSLELGGKSPVLVFGDADIDSAVSGALGGIFGASGQSCVAGSRLYLQSSIADEFLDKMTQQAAQIKIGNPMHESTQMGPLCTSSQLDKVKREIARAVTEGGQILCGGKQPEDLNGYYFEPTIIECPRQDMRIVDTELFAPVLSVLRFEDEDEAIQLANASQYGLAAGVFTRDSARSLRVSGAIRSGLVWVNTYRAISPVAEFGGFKQSGYGREGGLQAIYDYTRSKTVWMSTSSEMLQSQFINR